MRLDQMGIVFITLRRRSRRLLRDIALVPRSAWRRVHLDVPARKFQNPGVFEQPATIHAACFRQLFVDDLGHPEPTVNPGRFLLTGSANLPRSHALGASSSPASQQVRS